MNLSISYIVSDVNVFSDSGNSNHYQIMLLDTVTANMFDKNYFKTNPFKIILKDGMGVRLVNDNYPVDPDKHEQINQNIISINLEDGVETKTNYSNNDDTIKIIKIKQDHDRKALWERIFPLDRIRNNEKTLYKEIQNDHSLSYVQLSEINSGNPETEQFLVSNYDLQYEIDKFIGKANYVGIQLGKHWEQITDVEKFFGKANYLGDQLGIRAQQFN